MSARVDTAVAPGAGTGLRHVADPPVSPRLKEEIVRLWVDVTNAGGAVGFVPTVGPEDVRPELLKHLAAMAEGRMRLVVVLDEEGHAVGTAFLGYNTHRLMRHWAWLYTVMVHPSLQGRGAGRGLMAAAAEAAARGREGPEGTDGVTAIRLTCRGGTGADAFYAACGYQEAGRVPGAIRAGDGDFRDDITMWLPLDDRRGGGTA